MERGGGYVHMNDGCKFIVLGCWVYFVWGFPGSAGIPWVYGDSLGVWGFTECLWIPWVCGDSLGMWGFTECLWIPCVSGDSLGV